jgi:site-specific DNA-methyltransferase (adenine-specific)
VKRYAGGKKWDLYLGDALSGLLELPDAFVDGTVTDPPYSSGGQFRGDRLGKVTTKYLNSDSSTREYLPQFAGDNRDQRAYLTWSALWMGQALRVTKPGRALCCFTDWRQLPTTTDAIQAGGWVWRGVAPWIKRTYRPAMGRIAAGAEYVVWGTAGASADDEAVGCIPGWVLCSTPVGDDKVHVTQKPVEVMRWLLGIVPAGGLVLDPFAGAGSTGVAALATGRRFIGWEMTEENAEQAARRLEQAEHDGQQVGMFGPPP